MGKSAKPTTKNVATPETQVGEALNAIMSLPPEHQRIVRLTIYRAIVTTVRKIAKDMGHPLPMQSAACLANALLETKWNLAKTTTKKAIGKKA